MENDWLEFDCSPETGCFNLGWSWTGEKHPFIDSGRLGVIYRKDGQRFEALRETWQTFNACEESMQSPTQGGLRQVRIDTGADRQGVAFRLTFALVETSPLFLWKIEVENRGQSPILIEHIYLLESGSREGCGKLAVSGSQEPELAFYSNGWQSWNWTAAYGQGQRQRRTNLGLIEGPMYICGGTPQPKSSGHYSSDFFGVIGDRAMRTGWMVGFLSQKQHFGSIDCSLGEPTGLCMWANGDDAQLDPGGRMETDWAVVQPVNLDDPDPLGPFLDAAARENGARPPERAPSGWCSWYYYYQNLKDQDVRQNLLALRGQREKLPLELVQIDDGFERQVGDWFEFQTGFPEGVKPLAREIREAGFTPGLWLAPFIVHPKSHLFEQHPDWMLRGANGRPVASGYNWGATTIALDLTVPEALDYACRVVDTAAHEWGYPYLKLDFLYAGGLAGKRRDPHMTRAQTLRMGLEALRKAAGPETFLLGCGTPIGTSIGIFEGMRIGADVAGTWAPEFSGIKLFFNREPNMPSLRNAVQNTLTRAAMHGRWWANDPDCLLVRPDTRLTLAEVQSFATAVGMTGGSLIVSDDLPALPPDRLRIAEVLLPVLGRSAQVVDWFDRVTPRMLRLDLNGAAGAWHALALFNWEDRARDLEFDPEEFRLAKGAWQLRSFWDGKVLACEAGETVTFAKVPAHGVVLLAARPVSEGVSYLGSDLHFSQGVEVKEWEEGDGALRVKLGLPRKTSGSADLWLPGGVRSVSVDGADVKVQQVMEGVYRVPVRGESEIRVRF